MFVDVAQLYSRRASSAVLSLVVNATVDALGVVLPRDRIVDVQSRLLFFIHVNSSVKCLFTHVMIRFMQSPHPQNGGCC